MLVDFNSLPTSSRIWIFPSDRKLSPSEVNEIQNLLDNFISNWSAHGQELQASYILPHNRFIIVAVNTDVNQITGCSIDNLVYTIQEIEKKYNLVLLDKMNVTFKNGEFFAHKPLNEFKKMAKEKAVSQETIVFNNLVNTIDEWQDFWEVPVKESWHNRFF